MAALVTGTAHTGWRANGGLSFNEMRDRIQDLWTQASMGTAAEEVTYTYNERGLLASIASSVLGNIVTDTSYNPLGLPVQAKLSNSGSQNLFLRHRYHVLDSGSSNYPYGALWDIRLEKGSGPTQLFRLQHFYDYARNTTRVIEDGGQDLTYVLDDLDRLLKRKITGGADQETVEFDNVSGRGDGKIGNIVKKNGQTYTYGSKPHAVTNDGTQPCEYDPNGSMIRRGSLYLKYNPEDQMVKASTDSDGLVYIARFGLDGDGKRVKRVDNYGTIHYVGTHYERNVGTGPDTTEKITKFYVAQMGKVRRLVALRRKINGAYEDLRYVVTDHLGGTLRVVDTSGNTIDDIRYHAFGGTRSGGTNTPTDRRFTGQTLDMSTGLYFYNARYYDPALGRFLAADTAGPDLRNPQSLNKYSYVLNNPVKYTDPSGNRPLDDGGGGEVLKVGDSDAGGGDAGGESAGNADATAWYSGDIGSLGGPGGENGAGEPPGDDDVSLYRIPYPEPGIQPSGIVGETTASGPVNTWERTPVVGPPRLDILALGLYLPLEGPSDWGKWAAGETAMFTGLGMLAVEVAFAARAALEVAESPATGPGAGVLIAHGLETIAAAGPKIFAGWFMYREGFRAVSDSWR